MEVKILFHSSTKLSPSHGNLSIGKYTIEPLPDSSPGADSATTQYLLRFEDEMRPQDNGMSQPEVEGRLFLSYLSLLLSSKITVESMMVNSVNTSNPLTILPYSDYLRTITELPNFNTVTAKLRLKEIEVARQFCRACEVYRAAVNMISENNTFSYFLLTIAVECLSNKVGKGSGSCERFIDFILTYLPDKDDLENEEDWRELLKEVYYRHRSGFTHGGKEVPDAVVLADRLDRVYVRNVVDGKETRTPGLKWFEKVVHKCLVGFILSDSCVEGVDRDLFKEISMEFGKVMLKATRALKAHTLVTANDFHLD